MLISYNWLQLLIPQLNEDPYDLSERLSRSIAEVEGVTTSNDQTVFEVENKALNHRADLFGHIGWAREVSAVVNKNIVLSQEHTFDPCGSIVDSPKITVLSGLSGGKSERYMVAMIENITQKKSPSWLSELLNALGQRSISYIVDVTNYLMLKHAQPLHAFDADKLPSSTISVRCAKKDERITLLDDSELTLSHHDVVIDSGGVPIALAGIKGAKVAAIDESTTKILLESATFDQYAVRATSRRLGVRSEASLRFEKGLHPTYAYNTLLDAMRILTGQNEVLPSHFVDDYPKKRDPASPITISLRGIRHYLNSNTLSEKEIQSKLNFLGFSVQAENDNLNDVVAITPPDERTDVRIVEDVYEEIGRVFDYNSIIPTLPARDAKLPNRNDTWEFAYHVRDIFARLGVCEVLSYSFVDQSSTGLVSTITDGVINVNRKIDPELLAIKNPIAPEMGFMRTSLIPSLQQFTIENAKRVDSFGLFEINRVTIPLGSKLLGSKLLGSKLPNEPKLLCFTYYSKNMNETDTLLSGKNIWKTALTYLGVNEFTDLIPHQLTLEHTRGFAFSYEVDLDVLQSLRIPRMYTEIPLSMPTMNDISFTLPESQPLGDVIKKITIVGNYDQDITLRIDIIDRFQNQDMKKSARTSVTIRLFFSHMKRSLSDTEISSLKTQIEETLVNEFNATIR